MVNACVKPLFLYHFTQTAQLSEALTVQSALQHAVVSEEAVQVPHILLQVCEGKLSADDVSYSKLSGYI